MSDGFKATDCAIGANVKLVFVGTESLPEGAPRGIADSWANRDEKLALNPNLSAPGWIWALAANERLGQRGSSVEPFG